MVVIEAQEESDEPVEPLAEDVPADGPRGAAGPDHAGRRPRLRPARCKIVAAGRPPCPLCGLPLDTDGHVCPRQNGHRVGHA